jgi:hypothetical protein
VISKLLTKLPRKEDQQLLNHIAAAYEKNGKDGVEEMLEAEIGRIGEESIDS